MNISEILKDYDLDNITIGVLGGHSALDVCAGAKKLGLKTICVAVKGREQTYDKHYKTKETDYGTTGCIDECIVVDTWSGLLEENVQEELRKRNTIFIHNRYFWTYFNFQDIENNFKVPIYGSRELIKLEERDVPNNQYYLLEKAGIRIPQMFDIPKLSYKDGVLSMEEPKEEMNKLTLTKVSNAIRTYERANFVASNWEEWRSLAEGKLNDGEILIDVLQLAVIEEFVLGAQINFNFFYSALNDTVELMGTDMRRQTNLDGFLRLPAKEQLKIPEHVNPFHIETGHVAVTCKESLIEKSFIAAENFIKACKEHAQELIGPFALQGAIETDGKKEELIVFDVSMRIPGSPGISATPYTGYLYGENISMGERIAMEIREAQEKGELARLLT